MTQESDKGGKYVVFVQAAVNAEERKVTFQMDRTGMVRKKVIFFFTLVFFLLSCAAVKTYDETVSQWTSYEDVAKWMSIHFTYDMGRLSYTRGRGPEDVPPRTPEETFRLQSGVCYDAAWFAKKTLNRINPSYEAKVVWIRSLPISHFVCAFKKDGRLFIMDYGSPTRNTSGVLGPYDSLEEYARFFEKHHPGVTGVRSIDYWQQR